MSLDKKFLVRMFVVMPTLTLSLFQEIYPCQDCKLEPLYLETHHYCRLSLCHSFSVCMPGVLIVFPVAHNPKTTAYSSLSHSLGGYGCPQSLTDHHA